MGITIIGTNHISKESTSQVKKAINSGKYQLVAVELDHGRLHHLLTDRTKKSSFRDIRKKVGFWGATLATLGRYAEQKLGAKVGVLPGDEMLAAVEEAKKNYLKIALIDQPIEQTLKRVSEVTSFKTILNLIKNSFRKTNVVITYDSIPTYKELMILLNEFKKLSPELYQVLLEERDKKMAEHIIALKKHYSNYNMLVVVGAAHVIGIRKHIQNHFNKQSSQKPSEIIKASAQE